MSTATQSKIAEENNNQKRNQLLWAFTALLVVLGIVFLLFWIFYLQFRETTDDAYANGNMISINAVVEGSVVAFYADNTELVMQGQLLVQLDTTDFQIKYEKELATLANVVLQVQQLYDTALANQKIVESKKVALERAQFDYNNRSRLIQSLAVSKEDFVHSRDALLTAELELKQAEYQYKVSLDAVGNTDIENHPLIKQQEANVKEAYYQLKHCSIYAPATGYIAQRSVDVGEWVEVSTQLMSIIPKDYVWVDANFKETQLRHMRVGQPATVWFDMYGSDVKYHGKVLGIASGSGSVFSLIPPQNATGNWIKIVQRLPVRISLDPETVKNYPTRLGISAEVKVDTSDRDLPLLATSPSRTAVGITHVFDIDFTPVNEVINAIICENLNKGIDAR